MSTVTLSKPHCAITSAEKPDGIASQAFTTALPEAHTFLTLLVVMDRVSSVVSFDAGPVWLTGGWMRGRTIAAPVSSIKGSICHAGPHFPHDIARNCHLIEAASG